MGRLNKKLAPKKGKVGKQKETVANDPNKEKAVKPLDSLLMLKRPNQGVAKVKVISTTKVGQVTKKKDRLKLKKEGLLAKLHEAKEEEKEKKAKKRREKAPVVGDMKPMTDTLKMIDADGLTNADEINIHGTNPQHPDTDFDGLPDGDEVAGVTSALNPDTDGDGLDDAVALQVSSSPSTEHLV